MADQQGATAGFTKEITDHPKVLVIGIVIGLILMILYYMFVKSAEGYSEISPAAQKILASQFKRDPKMSENFGLKWK